jgi:hypothetical protein
LLTRERGITRGATVDPELETGGVEIGGESIIVSDAELGAGAGLGLVEAADLAFEDDPPIRNSRASREGSSPWVERIPHPPTRRDTATPSVTRP